MKRQDIIKSLNLIKGNNDNKITYNKIKTDDNLNTIIEYEKPFKYENDLDDLCNLLKTNILVNEDTAFIKTKDSNNIIIAYKNNDNLMLELYKKVGCRKMIFDSNKLCFLDGTQLDNNQRMHVLGQVRYYNLLNDVFKIVDDK